MVTYKKSQIKKLSKFSEYKKKKSKIINKLEEKKVNLKEIKNIYKEPKKLPGKVSKKLTKMVNKQRSELKHLYENPNEIFKSEKIKKWAGLQIVKVFLGIPVVPGK